MKIVPTNKATDKIQLGINDDGSSATILHKQEPGPVTKSVSFVEGKSLADVATARVNENETLTLLDSASLEVGQVGTAPTSE